MPFFKQKPKIVPVQQSLPTDLAPGSEGFYQASTAWLYDMYQSQTVWLRRALAGLVVLTVLLFLSLLINAMLFPLKQRVPYLYAFDNATGEVTRLGELAPSQLAANWQMTRYFLIHYVMNRESYDADNIDYPYQLAWAMSQDQVQRQYEGEVSNNNPNSPYRKYGKDRFITVNAIAVSRLSADTASVRFDKLLHDRTSGTQTVAHQEAIIKWQYTQPETTQKMLDRDPLGFKVIYYQATPVNLDNGQMN